RPLAQSLQGARSALTVPMLGESGLVGVLNLWRDRVQPFTDHEVTLVETFADQAALAIENTRLYAEVAERNQALSEALEEQTATAEVLRVISESPTDLQQVLETIVESAVRLSNAETGVISRRDGGRMVVA